MNTAQCSNVVVSSSQHVTVTTKFTNSVPNLTEFLLPSTIYLYRLLHLLDVSSSDFL